jgi:hypothetical protein
MTEVTVERTHRFDSNQVAASRLSSFLIPLLLCLCLVLLCIGVWKHVRRSEQPPLYDAISYMAKAKAFWDMVESGHWENPLNLQPVMRPPATILMSYPFGFSEEYKGFLARSVILPAVLFVAALYIAASRRRMSRAEHLDLLAISLILASLPCFYHFEAVAGINSPTYWGLVDNFFAAVAALAFSTGWRAIQSESWRLLALASLLTGLCLMIKPAGAVVALVIITLLITIKIIKNVNRPGGKLFSAHLVAFIVIVSAGTGLMLIAALKSAYLSSETVKYGNTAVAVLRTEAASGFSFASLLSTVYPAFGFNVIALGWATGIAIIWVSRESVRLRNPVGTLAKLSLPALATAVAAVGAFFWLVYAEISQVRYFYPFAFLSLILLVIFLLDALRGRMAPYTRALIYGSSGILFGSLIAMLYFSQIPSSWQRMLGVSLDSSSAHDERRVADLLLQEANTAGRDVNVYAMDIGWDFGSISSAGLSTKLIKPTVSSFTVRYPVDWQRPSVVRLKDLVFSDYILYHPVIGVPDRQQLLALRDIRDLSTETATISAWLTQANEESGLKEVANGRCAIKQVISPLLFEQRLARWAAPYNWRDVFKSENSSFFKYAEPAEPTILQGQNAGRGAAEIFDHTIAIESVTIETFSPLIFGVDWRSLGGSVPNDLFFFIHVLDGGGEVRSDSRFPLHPRLSEDKDVSSLHHTLQKTNIEAGSGTLRYGFGIYQGTHAEKLLTPEPAGGDFDGKRVLRQVTVQ